MTIRCLWMPGSRPHGSGRLYRRPTDAVVELQNSVEQSSLMKRRSLY